MGFLIFFSQQIWIISNLIPCIWGKQDWTKIVDGKQHLCLIRFFFWVTRKVWGQVKTQILLIGDRWGHVMWGQGILRIEGVNWGQNYWNMRSCEDTAAAAATAAAAGEKRFFWGEPGSIGGGWSEKGEVAAQEPRFCVFWDFRAGNVLVLPLFLLISMKTEICWKRWLGRLNCSLRALGAPRSLLARPL